MTRPLPLALILLAGLSCGRPEPPKHVVVIVIDTLRRDATSLAEGPHGWDSIMPNFDRLIETGRAYPNAWSTAPWTVPSHASLFTGLLTAKHGCDSPNLRLGEVGPTLAERFAEAGYETAAFFSNPWLSDKTTGMLRGFETKVEVEVGGLAELRHQAGDQGGRETLRNIDEWLERRDPQRPFLLFVNFLEAHVPYSPPLEQRLAVGAPTAGEITIDWDYEFQAGLRPPETVDWNAVARLYAADARWADVLLGDLMGRLVQRDLLAAGLVVVTSDHGENLGEHGLFEHVFSLHETLLQVPLVVLGEAFEPGLDDRPVMLTDLYPTLIEWAGLPDDGAPRQGRSLLAVPDPRRPVYGEVTQPGEGLLSLLSQLNPALDSAALAVARRTVRVQQMRLTASSGGLLELHDLAVDPGQINNIADADQETVEALRKLLAGLITGQFAGSGTAIDEETRQRLRSLGYVN